MLYLLACEMAAPTADYASDDEAAMAPSDEDGDADADADGDADADTAGDTGDDEDTAPPETESDYLRLAPAATPTYVFVANPDRDTLTRIDVATLAVRTTAVGDHPSLVVTGDTRAVTFNELSDDVSIVDAASLAVTAVEVRDDFNQMVMSDDGEWVMCWHDPDAESSGSNGGVQSFNEVSFVRLDDAEHFPMAVGPLPHAVAWTEDGSTAVVVSDASLAVIDLAVEPLSPTLIAIAEDPQAAPVAEEVVLSPDGRFAFVRQFGADEILVAELATGEVTALPVGRNPTDFDVTPDGASLAVLARAAHEIWTFDVADPLSPASVLSIPSEDLYGSMQFTPDGTQAVLYTNASLVPRYALWELSSGEIEIRSLVKPVRSAGMAGTSLLFFHTEEDDADTDPDFAGEWALTLVSLADFRENPMVLAAEPEAWAASDAGDVGYFILSGMAYLEMLDFGTLLVDEVRLPSEAVGVGVIPDSATAWVSQTHELGRLSFYDPAGETLDTITGFELNGEIDHE